MLCGVQAVNDSRLLIQLGVTPNYTSFYQTLYALELSRQNPESLLLVTKCLYPAVAKEFRTTWKAVERNIRSATAMAWCRNPSLLNQLAGYSLPAKPNAARFIAILFSAGSQ